MTGNNQQALAVEREGKGWATVLYTMTAKGWNRRPLQDYTTRADALDRFRIEAAKRFMGPL